MILQLIILLYLETALAAPSDYIPSPAPAGKKLEDYTVNDIIGGTFASKSKLVDSHPFRQCGQIEKLDFTWIPAIFPADMHQLADGMPDVVFDHLKKLS